MRFALATLSFTAAMAAAHPTETQIEKRSNSATTHGAAPSGVNYCDVSFGDAYYVHVGEPWAGGSGCNNIYNYLANVGGPNVYAITGWSCQPDGGPDANGWQPTYLGFNSPAGNQAQISEQLGIIFGTIFHCSY